MLIRKSFMIKNDLLLQIQELDLGRYKCVVSRQPGSVTLIKAFVNESKQTEASLCFCKLTGVILICRKARCDGGAETNRN